MPGSYATRRLPDGTLLIAMADGAGSAEYSADGAHTAVQAAVDHLEALLTRTVPVDERRWEQMMIRLFQEAQLAVSDAAFRAKDRCVNTPQRCWLSWHPMSGSSAAWWEMELWWLSIVPMHSGV